MLVTLGERLCEFIIDQFDEGRAGELPPTLVALAKEKKYADIKLALAAEILDSKLCRYLFAWFCSPMQRKVSECVSVGLMCATTFPRPGLSDVGHIQSCIRLAEILSTYNLFLRAWLKIGYSLLDIDTSVFPKALQKQLGKLAGSADVSQKKLQQALLEYCDQNDADFIRSEYPIKNDYSQSRLLHLAASGDQAAVAYLYEIADMPLVVTASLRSELSEEQQAAITLRSHFDGAGSGDARSLERFVAQLHRDKSITWHDILRYVLLDFGVDPGVSDAAKLVWRRGGINYKDAYPLFVLYLGCHVSKQRGADLQRWVRVRRGIEQQAVMYSDDTVKKQRHIAAKLKAREVCSVPIGWRVKTSGGYHHIKMVAFYLRGQHYLAYCNRGYVGAANGQARCHEPGIHFFSMANPDGLAEQAVVDMLDADDGESYWLSLLPGQGGVGDALGLKAVAHYCKKPQKNGDCALKGLHAELMVRLMVDHWQENPHIVPASGLGRASVSACVLQVIASYKCFRNDGRVVSERLQGVMIADWVRVPERIATRLQARVLVRTQHLGLKLYRRRVKGGQLFVAERAQSVGKVDGHSTQLLPLPRL